MHGNAVAALACHLEFILPTNFTNVYRCAIGFSPTDYTDFIDFFSLYDSLFCFAKIALRICTDFIAARWFFSPTNFTNITNVYRCAIGFSPTDYTDFIDFFLIIRFALLLCKNRSADLHRFYRCAMVFFAHKFHKYHECLSLRDRFFSHRLHRFYRFFSHYTIRSFALQKSLCGLHRFYRCAMVFLPTNFTNITNIYCYVIVFLCRFY